MPGEPTEPINNSQSYVAPETIEDPDKSRIMAEAEKPYHENRINRESQEHRRKIDEQIKSEKRANLRQVDWHKINEDEIEYLKRKAKEVGETAGVQYDLELGILDLVEKVGKDALEAYRNHDYRAGDDSVTTYPTLPIAYHIDHFLTEPAEKLRVRLIHAMANHRYDGFSMMGRDMQESIRDIAFPVLMERFYNEVFDVSELQRLQSIGQRLVAAYEEIVPKIKEMGPKYVRTTFLPKTITDEMDNLIINAKDGRRFRLMPVKCDGDYRICWGSITGQFF